MHLSVILLPLPDAPSIPVAELLLSNAVFNEKPLKFFFYFYMYCHQIPPSALHSPSGDDIDKYHDHK